MLGEAERTLSLDAMFHRKPGKLPEPSAQPLAERCPEVLHPSLP